MSNTILRTVAGAIISAALVLLIAVVGNAFIEWRWSFVDQWYQDSRALLLLMMGAFAALGALIGVVR